MEILGALHLDHAEATVAWRELNGYSLAHLVASRDTRKRVANALNDARGPSALVQFRTSVPGADAVRARGAGQRRGRARGGGEPEAGAGQRRGRARGGGGARGEGGPKAGAGQRRGRARGEGGEGALPGATRLPDRRPFRPSGHTPPRPPTASCLATCTTQVRDRFLADLSASCSLYYTEAEKLQAAALQLCDAAARLQVREGAARSTPPTPPPPTFS